MRRSLGGPLAQFNAYLRSLCHQTGSVGNIAELECEMASRDHEPHSIAVPLRTLLQDHFCQPAPVCLTQNEEEVFRLGEQTHSYARLRGRSPLERCAHVVVVGRPRFQQRDHPCGHKPVLDRNADR
jgi:hypothetical protein